MSAPLPVVIMGGSGYAGGELLRYLLYHPNVKVVSVMSRSKVGQAVGDVHRHLRGVTDLKFAAWDPPAAGQWPVVFLAMEHQQAHQVVKVLGGTCRIIDLSADFRIQDPQVYATYYATHGAPEWLKEAVYGLTEWRREEIRSARLVACPGCFAVGALMGLLPLAATGQLEGFVAIDGKTGSSGSGSQVKWETHHPERAEDFRAYGYFTHRHVPEIQQEVARVTQQVPPISFVSHSAPMVRGLLTTIHARLKGGLDPDEVKRLYQQRYASEPFVEVVDQPRTALVVGTNRCDIGVRTDGGGQVVVITAIDNLGKGAAGQAVQNLNVMMGWPETTGLLASPPYP